MASTMSEKGSFTFTVGKLGNVSFVGIGSIAHPLLSRLQWNNPSFVTPSVWIDAGMAILIGSRAHLIEFPSILLPDGVGIGSIVSIDVHRNINEEEQQKAAFWKLQNDIYMMYGIQTPVAPLLKLRHVTQTSVTLEWAPLQLATATLRSLDIYRSGSRLATIPNPTTTTSSKLSSLQISTTYTFQLVLRTTAGTYPSNIVEVKTRAIEDTSGISVCFGTILDADVEGDSGGGGMGGGGGAKRKEELKAALEEMGAKWSDKIQIDTTHFVCTTSLSLAAVGVSAGVHSGLATATANASAGALKTTGEEPGVEYQKATQLSIPIVQPDWVLACYYGKKMVPTAPYYLGTSIPPLVQGHNRVQSISQRQFSQPPLPPVPPTTTTATVTSSTTPPRRTSSTAPQPFIASTPGATKSLPKNPSSSPHITPPAGSPFFTGGDALNSADPTVPALPSSSTSTATATQSNTAGGEEDLDDGDESPTTPSGKSAAAAAAAARKRTGTMNKAFKFPPGADGKRSPGLTISPPPPMPIGPPIIVVHEAKDSVDARLREAMEGGHGREDRGRGVEPPTPDLESASGSAAGMEGREEADEGGEIFDVDLS